MLTSTEDRTLLTSPLFLFIALILSDFSDFLTMGPEASRNMSEMLSKANTCVSGKHEHRRQVETQS